jgi:UDP-N-acetylmuramoyl-tripeptide--D-alanyl-D-alanine ligase
VNSACATLATVTDAPQPSLPRTAPEVTLSGAEIARLTGGRLARASDRPIRGAAVDSRNVRPGNLFIALPGERTDGHDHLVEAVEAGATALLVSRPGAPPAAVGDVSVIAVGRPIPALQALATAWRRRFQPLTVGITGSIAKTSTKEAVAGVLATRFRTLSNQGNENNEIGLPLTVLRLGPEHEALVLEMGMYVEGEIADLVRIGCPRIGVVTAVQPVHLSRIGTLEAIETEKGRLVEGLPADGTAILNADDPRVRRMAARTAARVVEYGFADHADVGAERVESAGEAGMRFVLRTAVGRREIVIPTLGRHAVHNALAAAAVGLAAGLTLEEVAVGLAAGSGAPHRGELIRLGGVTVIDDSYNAAPASMLAALDLLASLPGRRVAILGEMLELGDGGEAAHRAVGRAAARVADLLVVVGAGASGIAQGARQAGLEPERILRADDRDAARDLLRPRLVGGDVVLVKASRGIGLERLIDDLREDLEP